MKDVQVWVGIDAGADMVALCATDTAGNVLVEATTSASLRAIEPFLSPLDERMRLGIEAGSTSIHLTRSLRAAGYDVTVMEARYVSAFLQVRQNKSDRNDAHGIAEVLRVCSNAVPEVLVKDGELQKLRSEIVLRHRLMQERCALEAAIRAVFRLNGGKITRTYSGTHLERSVTEEIDRLRATGNDLGNVLLPALEVAVILRRTLEKYDRRLARVAKGDAVCRRLMSVPGVGCICALSFYTAVQDPWRFEQNHDVGPYLGLTPRLNQSGQTTRMGRISKRGNQMTRTHLVSAAKSLMQQSNKECALRRWAMSIKARAGPSKARIALARKMAIVLLAIWKSGRPFNAEPVRMVAGELQVR